MKIVGLVYARWCPHCTAMKPQWDIMKSKLRSNCRVIEIEDSDYDKQSKIEELNNDIKELNEQKTYYEKEIAKDNIEINNGEIFNFCKP